MRECSKVLHSIDNVCIRQDAVNRAMGQQEPPGVAVAAPPPPQLSPDRPLPPPPPSPPQMINIDDYDDGPEVVK